MLRVPLSNPSIKRTLRPLYANHQATSWGGFLDPEFDPVASGTEIFPGTVMSRTSGDIFTPYDGSSPPFGLSALFVAPSLGVNEVTSSGTNLFTVWVGGVDAEFEILHPAFDPLIQWSDLNDPATAKPILLTGTSEVGGPLGLLTTTGANSSNSIAELIDVVSPTKIIVRLRQAV